MRLNVAICDDEIIICNEIKRRLLEIRPEYAVSLYNSGKDLVNSKTNYELVFLDIEMPEIDGMKTAELLRKNDNSEYIIFLTSHIECMPDAFKVKAFRFLSKPIDNENFLEAVIETEKEILNNTKIEVIQKDEIKLISINEILYLEAFGDGTYIYTKNGVLESNKTLKYWNDRLGTEHFFQTHKTYILALRYVGKVADKEVTLNYENIKIPIARRRHKQLKEAVMKYVREQSHHI